MTIAHRKLTGAGGILLIVPLSFLICGGCGSRIDKEESRPWTAPRWQEAQRQNTERFKSEDQRSATGNFLMGPLQKVRDVAWDQIVRLYNFFTGDTPFDAAKNMLDPSYPDRRRQAIMYLSKFQYGRQDPYVKYYAEMARTDLDYTVRAMAIRALNRCRTNNVTTIYLSALDDRNELVRMEGAKALANIAEPLAVQSLLKRLEDPEENMDVRIAAADALRCYQTGEVAQALVRALRDPQFGVSWQARISLKLMTGQDYRYDQTAWLTYLAEKSVGGTKK